MRWLKRGIIGLLGFLLLAAAGLWFWLPHLNGYKTSGSLDLAGLDRPGSILRDEKGMPYIVAADWRDALFLQGFATAQDRLFQMQLNKMFASGRIAELAGPKARKLDVLMRTIGLGRIAARALENLEAEDRALLQAYADGVNAFLHNCPDDVPLEFALAGIKPEPWRPVDSMTILYYMGFSTSANLATEIRAQVLVDKLGIEKAKTIFPLNINPEDPSPPKPASPKPAAKDLGLLRDERLAGLLRPGHLALGSNNWAISPAQSGGKAPILAGDPHLDTRILPGVWHAVGLFTDNGKAVGAIIPGLPGIAVGRTEHVAMSMTNSYGDTQDLYIEQTKPGQPGLYRELGRWVPFQLIKETLRIKDSHAEGGFRQEEITIRRTRRGPVVSGVLPGLSGDRVMSLRWSPAERMGKRLGLFKVFQAKTVHDVNLALRDLPMLMLNWVFADTSGNIAFRASGSVPIRRGREGTLPAQAGGPDDWVGFLPFEMMPSLMNPSKGWVGTANHMTVRNDSKFYYSSYFAPTYRYRRIMELMSAKDPKGPKDAAYSWRAQRDDLNLLARDICPYFVAALAQDKRTEGLAAILRDWDYHDSMKAAGPTIFQYVLINLAPLVFEDELGPKATKVVLGNWYFWQQRLAQMVKMGVSPFFDNVNTKDKVETRDQLIVQAGVLAQKQLGERLGGEPGDWAWGKVHTIEFVNPIRRSGFGKELLGSGKMPMGGSGETLYRGWYELSKPAEVTISASLRMVVDLADSEKVWAVLSGGEVARTFHPHQKDQTRNFMNGKPMYWWFGEQAVQDHTVSSLQCNPF